MDLSAARDNHPRIGKVAHSAGPASQTRREAHGQPHPGDAGIDAAIGATDEDGRLDLGTLGPGLEVLGQVLATGGGKDIQAIGFCLLYTSDAADE